MLERKSGSVHRLLRLVTKLMGGGRPSAEELSRLFDVTERTIYRDVTALEDMGFPIERDGGRYSIMETFKMRPVQFTAEEILAVVAALDFAKRSPVLASKSAVSAAEKLLAGMPTTHRELAADLDENLVVDPLHAHSVPSLPGAEHTLTGAIQGNHPVRIKYVAMRSETPTERVVHPYGLAYRGVALYLIGYCTLRNETRTFRVNRILELDVQPAVFIRPADFNLEKYLAGIWGIENGPMMQVRVRFAPKVARLAVETIWHPTQKNDVRPDGSVIVRIETRGRGELARWLAGYGDQVEVLEPAELREAVAKLGREIAGLYGAR